MTADPVTIAVLIAVVSMAAFVNGTIGFGFALLAVNALAVVVGAKSGVIVMSLLAPVVSGLQLWHHRAHASLWRRLVSLLAGALVGSVIGTQLLVVLPPPVIALALGLFTVWYVIGALRTERPPLAGRMERRLAPVAGVVGGISNGTIGASGPVFGTYLTAIGLRGAEFAFAISLSFFTMSLLRVGLLAALDQYTSPLLVTAAALYLPSVAFQRVGFWFQGRLPAQTLGRVVLLVLLVAGVNLLWRGTSELLAPAG